MSKKLELDKSQLSGDEILDALAISSLPVLDMCDDSENHSMLVIGARLNDEDEENPTINTFIGASGFLEILGEGLFSELSNQISSGDTALFSVLRDTIRSLEEHLGIQPDEELDDDEDTPHVLH
jgi:hypothetical protein